MRTTLLTLTTLALLFTACAPGTDESLLATCDGTYSCDHGGTTVTTMLARQGDQCSAGELALHADGTATAPGVQSTWSGTTDRFTLCAAGDCTVCVRQSPPESSGAAAGAHRCSGVAPVACPAYPGTACSLLDGCYRTHTWNGRYYDDECEGTPTACRNLASETACSWQLGCYWE